MGGLAESGKNDLGVGRSFLQALSLRLEFFPAESLELLEEHLPLDQFVVRCFSAVFMCGLVVHIDHQFQLPLLVEVLYESVEVLPEDLLLWSYEHFFLLVQLSILLQLEMGLREGEQVLLFAQEIHVFNVVVQSLIAACLVWLSCFLAQLWQVRKKISLWRSFVL